MNVAIILDHFEYFLAFSKRPTVNQYFYFTQRNRFASSGIKNINKFDFTDDFNLGRTKTVEKYDHYFKSSIKLDENQSKIDYGELALRYEEFFIEKFQSNKIECLITGAVTGFERCSLTVARRLGIRTLCVWEGFFRPSTISLDSFGMNSESEFRKKSWNDIENHIPSEFFNDFYSKYIDKLRKNPMNKRKLGDIHGDKFKLLSQLKNRFVDRNDIERIRLPFNQHFSARFSYIASYNTYKKLDDIRTNFIFFPLQTHTDSNFLINSSLYPLEEYLNLLVKSFQTVFSTYNCALLIKEHPLDVYRKSYVKKKQNGIYWLHPTVPTEIILNDMRCVATIVINSTVGFESLLFNKPVLVMGDALYKYPELTLSIDVFEKETLIDKINSLITFNLSVKAVEKFSSCLFDETQFSGNLYNIPSENEIESFEELINIKSK